MDFSELVTALNAQGTMTHDEIMDVLRRTQNNPARAFKVARQSRVIIPRVVAQSGATPTLEYTIGGTS